MKSQFSNYNVGRRQVLSAIGVAGAATALRPLSAFAQAAARPIVAFLVPQTKESFADQINSFLAGMKELGYVEGQNFAVEYRYADGVLDRQAALAAELVKLGPAVFVTGNASSIRLSEATSTIPIVVGNFTAGSAGLTQLVGPNLARPLVANVTGSANADVGPRQQLELIKEIFPSVTQVGHMLGTDSVDGGANARARAEAGAAVTGIKLAYAEVKTANDLEPAFRSLAAQRVPVILFSDAALFGTTAARNAALGAETRIPCCFNTRTSVAAGGLISLGPDSVAGFKVAATYVDKILKGAKPSDLPVQQSQAQLLTINLATAKTLGLTIPPAVVARATETIGA